jgi:hypothetical protein
MAAVKMNFSFDPQVAEVLRRRAQQEEKSASRYVADLILADHRHALDLLAAEGYRELAADTTEFAAAALPLARETWPEWEG